MIKAWFPPKLKGLFKPNRYKTAFGGRGSGKSWAFARALLIKGAETELRILCTREVQKSIKQSVHQLLSDQIEALGLGEFYEILDTEIRGRNGTQISFAGLAGHTVDSVKSFEGCDIVWVEEAQTVCNKSWKVLIPTIRKPDSEIWITFNPALDTDETYVRFVTNARPESMCVHINWSDNKEFPEVLEKERLHDKEHLSEEEYNNIWEGACKASVDGAIYANEVAKSVKEGRVCNVPYDPLLKVHVVFDLGWNDAMFISLVQKGVSDGRIIEAIEDSHKTLAQYSIMLRERKYNWGTVYLPHDGGNKDFKTGMSSQQIMERLGWSVEVLSRDSIEEGIKVARMNFPRFYFDKVKAAPLFNSLKRYRRAIPTATNEPAKPLHDDASHGADNFRYINVAASSMVNDPQRTYQSTQYITADSTVGY